MHLFQDMLKDCGADVVCSPEKLTFKSGQHSMILVKMDTDREAECKGEAAFV